MAGKVHRCVRDTRDTHKAGVDQEHDDDAREETHLHEERQNGQDEKAVLTRRVDKRQAGQQADNRGQNRRSHEVAPQESAKPPELASEQERDH